MMTALLILTHLSFLVSGAIVGAGLVCWARSELAEPADGEDE